jgi:hypothetical protein
MIPDTSCFAAVSGSVISSSSGSSDGVALPVGTTVFTVVNPILALNNDILQHIIYHALPLNLFRMHLKALHEYDIASPHP